MRRAAWTFTAIVVAAAVTFVVVRRHRAEAASGADAGSQQSAPRAVPVAAAAAARRDVPIYLDGLGNATAFKTVTVRTQVDGRLDRVLFKEGQRVETGQILAQIDPRPFEIQLHQAEGALARDTAQQHDNQKNLERYKTLADQKLIAQQQADDQRAVAGASDGAVAIDRAQIESAKLNLEYARISSPIDGVTGVRLVDPGNVVHPGDAGGIVVVAQIDPIAVLFTLPQDELPRVAQQLRKGPLSVEAWSRDGAFKLGTGQLALIDNQINATTATMRLKAIFKNPEHALWPNQFVKARLLVDLRQGALVVPATAIQRGPKGLFVYVIGADQTVQPRPVDVELTQGDLALLRDGIQPGEQVVTDGQNQLRPGAKVSVRQPEKPEKAPKADKTDKADKPAQPEDPARARGGTRGTGRRP